MGKAHHDLPIILVGHGLDLHGVLQGGADRLFHVQGNVMLQHHFHIVQPFGGRRADDHIVGLDYIFLNLFVAAAGAAKLLGYQIRVGLADVKTADDLAA